MFFVLPGNICSISRLLIPPSSVADCVPSVNGGNRWSRTVQVYCDVNGARLAGTTGFRIFTCMHVTGHVAL